MMALKSTTCESMLATKSALRHYYADLYGGGPGCWDLLGLACVLQIERTSNSQEPVHSETDRWRVARQAKPTTGTGFGGFGTSTTPNPFTPSQVNMRLVLRSVPVVV